MVNRMIAATIGFLIAVISFAPNEACARSAGSGGAIGRGAVGLGPSRSINRSGGTIWVQALELAGGQDVAPWSIE